jgi:hypothetical protein
VLLLLILHAQVELISESGKKRRVALVASQGKKDSEIGGLTKAPKA